MQVIPIVIRFLWEAERQQAQSACANCGRGEACSGSKHARCGKCKKVHYCSATCQKAHWPEHKLLCRRASSKHERRGPGRR
jgi:hypothetical protein